MAAPVKSTPKDSQVMQAILKDMGVVDYEPRVLNQMLEFTYRYVTDILDDAKVYSNHAGKKNIDVEDVKLSIQCRLDHSFTTPPPRDLLMDVSRHKNNTALPLIKPYTGPKLPPDRYCLLSSNYRLKALKRRTINLPGANINTSLVTPRINIQPALGGAAAFSKPTVNINPLRTKSVTVVSRGMAQPTFTMRPAVSTSVSATAMRPIIRLTPGTGSSPAVKVTPTVNVSIENPLKRKREDETDYDKP